MLSRIGSGFERTATPAGEHFNEEGKEAPMRYDSFKTVSSADRENRRLAQIIEAMLEVETDLQDATVEQWSRILLDSCRRRRREAAVTEVPVA